MTIDGKRKKVEKDAIRVDGKNCQTHQLRRSCGEQLNESEKNKKTENWREGLDGL